MQSVVLWQGQGRRARLVCSSSAQALRDLGYRVSITDAKRYDGRPNGDIAVHYGLKDRLRDVNRDYPAGGKTAVLIDLGYWGRHEGGRHEGYHRLSVDGLHPVAYFQRRRHGPERFLKLGLPPCRPRHADGKHVLIAGMSAKAAWVFGLAPEEWERATVAAVKAVTDRPIRYRPKPSWTDAGRIEGTIWADPARPLADDLAGCHAVVTHHSHVAIDAIMSGVPVFVVDGVARPVSNGMALDRLEAPEFPDAGRRDQWLWDIAWTQWRLAEIRQRLPWRHLIDEGILPAPDPRGG